MRFKATRLFLTGCIHCKAFCLVAVCLVSCDTGLQVHCMMTAVSLDCSGLAKFTD